MNLHIPESNLKRIVIVGGGFGGLKLLQDLGLRGNYQVVLMDKHNFHQFQPLFYQVATAGLEASSIVFPFRRVMQKMKNVHFRIAQVDQVNSIQKILHTDIGEVSYDYLVLANGAGTNFFGNASIAKFALPMKTLSEALSLRNHLFENFENALSAETEQDRQAFLTIVIVGGGPTGVEIAGTLAEMRKFILPRDYPELDFSQMKIILLEGSDRLLNGMSSRSSKKSLTYLQDMGVQVRTEALVTDYDGRIAVLKEGEEIHTKNLVWAAGIVANRIEGLPEDSMGPGRRVKVDAFNFVEGVDGILAIGDVSWMTADPAYPKGHPQLAQTAIQQAANLSKNFERKAKGKEKMTPFIYKNLGSMATVGRNKAVVDLPKFHFSGFFAWAVWMLVHLRSILGVKNKVLIFLDWLWSYFTYNLSLRLIIHKEEKKMES